MKWLSIKIKFEKDDKAEVSWIPKCATNKILDMIAHARETLSIFYTPTEWKPWILFLCEKCQFPIDGCESLVFWQKSIISLLQWQLSTADKLVNKHSFFKF